MNDEAVPLTGRVASPGELIQFRITGGSIPAGATSSQYVIRVRFTTSLGNQIEAVVVLRIRDIPL